jgi:hypothetical protein
MWKGGLNYSIYVEPRLICPHKAKVSKADYSSKANSFNVQYFAPPIETLQPYATLKK